MQKTYNVIYIVKVFKCVVLFIMLYKEVLSFESVDEILNCGHSNESFLLYKVVQLLSLWMKS